MTRLPSRHNKLISNPTAARYLSDRSSVDLMQGFQCAPYLGYPLDVLSCHITQSSWTGFCDFHFPKAISGIFFPTETASDWLTAIPLSISSSPISPESTMTNDSALNDAVRGKGVHIDSEKHICWDEDAEQHPRNWKSRTKAYTTVLICWLEMYMTAISSSGVSLVTAIVI